MKNPFLTKIPLDFQHFFQICISRCHKLVPTDGPVFGDVTTKLPHTIINLKQVKMPEGKKSEQGRIY